MRLSLRVMPVALGLLFAARGALAQPAAASTAAPRLKRMLLEGRTPAEIFAAWGGEVAAFELTSARCRLY